MSIIPSAGLERAFARAMEKPSVPYTSTEVPYGGRTSHGRRTWHGRQWMLAHSQGRTVWSLEHYGTVIIEIDTERDDVGFIPNMSASDRDAANGLLRLLGMDGRFSIAGGRTTLHGRDE